MEQKTIVLIKSHEDVNNVTSNIDELGRILTILEYDVRIISFNKDDPISLPILQVARWIPSSLFGFFKTPFAVMKLGMVASLILMLKKSIRPSLIVVENLSYIIPLLKICGNLKIMYVEDVLKKMPIIDQVDNYRSRSRRHQIYYLKYVDEVVVSSQISKFILENRALNVNKTTTILYPNIETPNFLKARHVPPQNIISSLCNDSTVILTFGDYIPESNFKLAIASFEQVQTKFRSCNLDNVYLIICGFCYNNTELNYMNNLMDNTIEGTNIIFVKNMSVDLITSLMKLAKCVLFPSIYFNHDQIFLMQSLSMGKIVIATECGITDELIEHEINGYISDPCIDEFVHFMVKVLTEPYTHSKMEKKVKSIFSAHHGEHQYISQVKHIIDQCLREHEEDFMQDNDENREDFTSEDQHDNSQNDVLYDRAETEDESVLFPGEDRTTINFNEGARKVIIGPPGSTPFPYRVLKKTERHPKPSESPFLGEGGTPVNTNEEASEVIIGPPGSTPLPLRIREETERPSSAISLEFDVSDTLQEEVGEEDNESGPLLVEAGTPVNTNEEPSGVIIGPPGSTPLPHRIRKETKRPSLLAVPLEFDVSDTLQEEVGEEDNESGPLLVEARTPVNTNEEPSGVIIGPPGSTPLPHRIRKETKRPLLAVPLEFDVSDALQEEVGEEDNESDPLLVEARTPVNTNEEPSGVIIGPPGSTPLPHRIRKETKRPLLAVPLEFDVSDALQEEVGEEDNESGPLLVEARTPVNTNEEPSGVIIGPPGSTPLPHRIRKETKRPLFVVPIEFDVSDTLQEEVGEEDNESGLLLVEARTPVNTNEEPSGVIIGPPGSTPLPHRIRKETKRPLLVVPIEFDVSDTLQEEVGEEDNESGPLLVEARTPVNTNEEPSGVIIGPPGSTPLPHRIRKETKRPLLAVPLEFDVSDALQEEVGEEDNESGPLLVEARTPVNTNEEPSGVIIGPPGSTPLPHRIRKETKRPLFVVPIEFDVSDTLQEEVGEEDNESGLLLVEARTPVNTNEETSGVIIGPPGSTPLPHRIRKETKRPLLAVPPEFDVSDTLQEEVGEEDNESGPLLVEARTPVNTNEEPSGVIIGPPGSTPLPHRIRKETKRPLLAVPLEFDVSDALQEEVGEEDDESGPLLVEARTPVNTNEEPSGVIIGPPGSTPLPHRIRKETKRPLLAVPLEFDVSDALQEEVGEEDNESGPLLVEARTPVNTNEEPSGVIIGPPGSTPLPYRIRKETKRPLLAVPLEFNVSDALQEEVGEEDDESGPILVEAGTPVNTNEEASEVIIGPPGSTPLPHRVWKETERPSVSTIPLEFAVSDEHQDEIDEHDQDAPANTLSESNTSDQNEIGAEDDGSNANSGEVYTPDNTNVSVLTGSPGSTPFPHRMHKRDEKYLISTPSLPSDDDEN